MGLFDFLTKPRCERCGDRIKNEPVDFEGMRLCPTCHRGILAHRASIDARRKSEEDAMQRIIDRQKFSDPMAPGRYPDDWERK